MIGSLSQIEGAQTIFFQDLNSKRFCDVVLPPSDVEGEAEGDGREEEEEDNEEEEDKEEDDGDEGLSLKEA